MYKHHLISSELMDSDKQSSEEVSPEESRQDIADDPILMAAITLLLVMAFILNKMNMECTC